MRLSEAFNLYARDVIAFRNQSPRTEENHFVACKALINYLGDIPVDILSIEHVRSWKFELEATRKPDTVRAYLIKLRVVLNYLRTHGHVIVIEPDDISLPERSKQFNPGIIAPEGVTRLIDACGSAKNKAIVSLLYSTGLRVGTLCTLDRKTVENNFFTITSKGGSVQKCCIDARTRQLLDEYLATRGDSNPALFISPSTGKRIKSNNVQELFKRIRKPAGFDWPVHPHTLRHSFLSNLAMNNAPLIVMKELAGHANIATTSQYLHIHDHHLIEAFDTYHSLETRGFDVKLLTDIPNYS